MSDAPDLFNLTTSTVLGGVYFLYAWRKQKTQFGSRRGRVNVYTGDARVRCHLCEGDVFQKREGLINTTWMTLFKLDPFNESAHCIVCNSCGYVHWFASRHGVGPAGYLRYEEASGLTPGKAI